MKIDIRSKTFFVRALRGNQSLGYTVDTEVTSLLASQRQVPIDKMTQVTALKPYVTLKLSGGVNDLMVAVRIRALKGEQEVYKRIFDRWYTDEIAIDPEDIVNIAPFKRGNRHVGIWTVNVEIALFPSRIVDQLNPATPEESLKRLLQNLRYQSISSVGFEVQPEAPLIELTPTGRFAETRSERDTGTTYDISDL